MTKNEKINSRNTVSKKKTFDPFNATQFWKPFRSSTMQRYDCLPFHEDYNELIRNTEIS